MLKRTLVFSNPICLSLKNSQLVLSYKDDPDNKLTIPIEDIGVVVLDHRQITLTQGLMAALLNNQTAVITCDDRRMPAGLLLPLEGNTLQNERFRSQIEASVPLK